MPLVSPALVGFHGISRDGHALWIDCIRGWSMSRCSISQHIPLRLWPQGEVAGVWGWPREEQIQYPQAPKPLGRLILSESSLGGVWNHGGRGPWTASSSGSRCETHWRILLPPSPHSTWVTSDTGGWALSQRLVADSWGVYAQHLFRTAFGSVDRWECGLWNKMDSVNL